MALTERIVTAHVLAPGDEDSPAETGSRFKPTVRATGFIRFRVPAGRSSTPPRELLACAERLAEYKQTVRGRLEGASFG